jgi:RNA polymerase sigma factor (sigma-70 family)
VAGVSTGDDTLIDGDSLVASLVASAADGNQQAWATLVDRFDGLLWSIARSFRLGQADAADVVQISWLRLLEHLTTIRQPERVGGWLATTVRHECLALLRRQARHGVPLDEPEALVADLPAAEQSLLNEERDAELWDALQRLSDLCRNLLRVLASDPAPTYLEVASALEMPVGSIGPRRGRCLEQLRRQLAIASGESR